MYRSGIGYDVHRLIEGRPLILGGVEIPFEKGLEGHSDADVLTHALMDAILGALSLGDLGQHFPDTDEQYRNISSLELCARVVSLMQEKKYGLLNADSVVIAQKPGLQPFIPTIRGRLAGVLGADRERINVKATTNEGLDSLGSGKGIAAYCVVMLHSLTV